MYRINDLVKTARVYRSPSHMDKHKRGEVDREMRLRGKRIHSGPMNLAGWSDAA